MAQGHGRAAKAFVVVLAAAGGVVQVALVGTWFNEVIELMGWPLDDGSRAFLFELDQSPVWGSLRAIFERGRVDLWLYNLGGGFMGRAGNPVAALPLAALWSAATVAAALRLREVVAHAQRAGEV